MSARYGGPERRERVKDVNWKAILATGLVALGVSFAGSVIGGAWGASLKMAEISQRQLDQAKTQDEIKARLKELDAEKVDFLTYRESLAAIDKRQERIEKQGDQIIEMLAAMQRRR